ncbi:ATP-binding protein [Oceanispirochaeta sp.]|jgi:DNA replication protein DnaC|uniref:ATP-binding protein n=1 Tax=Oceanispirochaeta sp. TaxID=2035350 RepID=UPI00262497C8|nr:ATP-binding protein [Oceanispirochaeta sp.]MDA3955229.1 ATP-binding protein [Oceanispirochaeta sp.]
METHTQIKQNLKQLRLSSIYENFEQRLSEAVMSKMGYADFLLLLTQDEIERRRQKKQETTIKKANLGKYKRLP